VKIVSENFSNNIAYKIHKAVFVMDKIADSSLFYQTGLTLSQYLILMNIVDNPGLSQIEIAKFHELTQAAVSRQIDVLKLKDLIHIKKNEANRRENLLFPTLMGREVFAEATKILDEEFKNLYSCMEENEKENFEKSLDKLLFSVCKNKKSTNLEGGEINE
jgi:DNA-binding MarR family transcriptional regulator